jgi:hypothetical protein
MDSLRESRFAKDDELEYGIREELRLFSKDFYAIGT